MESRVRARALWVCTIVFVLGSSWSWAEDLRLLGGYQGAVGNSAAPRGRYYFEVSGDANIKGKLGTWGYARITAMPQQVDAPIQQFITNLATNVGNVKVNELGHSAEFTWGLKANLGTVSPLIGVGVTTALEPTQNVNVFKVDPAQLTPDKYPQTIGKDYVAFVPPSRDRSFWQYMIGARFTPGSNSLPAWLDVTIGQNEFISGGHFQHAVVRAEGYWRLTDFSQSHAPEIYLFVSGMYKLGASHLSTPLILEAASGVSVPAPNVGIVVTPLSQLDITRFGVAIDFGCVIKGCAPK